MNAKDCRTVRLEIDTADLGQRLAEPLEQHLAGCAACAEFRTERAQLRELVGSLKPVAAPPDFDLRLRARMARERESRARQPFIFRFAMTTPAIAIVAILVVGVASIVWLNQRNQTPRNDTAVVTPGNDKASSAIASAPTPNDAGNQSNVGPVETFKQPETVKFVNQAPRNAVKSLPTVNAAARASDFSANAAQSFKQTQDRAGEVSLSAPSKPMVVSVRDANGATHKILLPPISFGSQRLDTRTPVSMSNGKDW